MAQVDPNQGIMPSLLDRLIDPEAGGTAWRYGYGVEQMVAAVHRDLEELLNTRQAYPDLPAEYTELQRSILAYGLPDLTSLNAVTPQHQERIGRLLETVITRFEPRLRDVRAELVAAGDGKDRTISFRVVAKLGVDPAPEVSFDTVLELTTNHYSVKQTGA